MIIGLSTTAASQSVVVEERNRILAALPAESRARLLPQLERVALTAGQVLHEPSEPIRYGYFPLDCVVALECQLENGQSTEVAVVGKEGLVGVSLCLGTLTATNQASVLCAGTAYRVPVRQLVQEFNAHADFQALVLRYTQCLMMQIAQTAICNRYHSIDQRLRRLLLQSLDRVRNNRLAMTHESMAHMLGVRREGVTAAASHLQQIGAIDYKRGHITVLDRPRLLAQSCECYAVVKNRAACLSPTLHAA